MSLKLISKSACCGVPRLYFTHSVCLFWSGYWRKHQIKDMTQTAHKYSYIPAAQETKSSKCSFIYSLSTKYSDSKERGHMTPSSEGGWRRLCENCHIWRMRGQVVRTAHLIGSGVQASLPRSCMQESAFGLAAQNNPGRRDAFGFKAFSRWWPESQRTFFCVLAGAAPDRLQQLWRCSNPRPCPLALITPAQRCLTRRIRLRGCSQAMEPPVSAHTLAALPPSL